MFASTLKANRKKLDPRSRKCIYLGFKHGVKGHLLFDLHSKEIFLSRDVKFFEHIFPYKIVLNKDGSSHSGISSHIFETSIPYFDNFHLDSQNPPPTTTTNHNNPHIPDPIHTLPHSETFHEPNSTPSHPVTDPNTISDEPHQTVNQPEN